MTPKTNFCFIGGAPKAGTSSLFTWLSTHPEICAAHDKEPFYFVSKESPLFNKGIENFTDYLRLFPEKGGSKIKIDGTTHILYNPPSRIDDILSIDDDAKFIFILRHPVNRLVSSFNFTKNNLLRIDTHFMLDNYLDALRQNKQDVLNTVIHNESSLFVLKNDLLYSSYSFFLTQWFKKVKKDNIKVLLFEELQRNPEKVVKEVADFLDIDAVFFDSFALNRENESINIKHKKLFRFAKLFTKLIPKGDFKKRLKKVFVGNVESNELYVSEVNRLFLEDYFRDEIQNLQSLGVNLDFSTWKGVAN